jgi:glycosyltransferase involved in cell wall biosynthesis
VIVYFYGGGFIHNLHRESYQSPPDGVTFIPSTPALERETDAAEIRRQGARPIPRLGLAKAALATMSALGVPKIKSIRAPANDLIHSTQDPLLTRHPWVVEVEDVSAFFWYRRRILAKPLARMAVQTVLARESCRAILPWTDAAKRSVLRGLDCSSFAHKIRTVYPCIAPRARATPPGDRVKLLFVGSTFYTKGGVETLRAFRRVKDVRAQLVMITPAPPELSREVAFDPRIIVASGVSREELEHHYRTASAFVLPVHADTLGFVFLEAMAHGVPCISTNHFALPEIVRHEQTGLLVAGENSYFDSDGLPRFDPPMSPNHELVRRVQSPSDAYVDRLSGAMERLISDSVLRRSLSDGAFDEVAAGRFSRAHRRAQMKQVYEEAAARHRP